MKLASLKTIFRNNKSIDVIANKLDDNSVSTINIENSSVTMDKLSVELQDLLNNTMVQKFYSTTEPDNRTFSDPKYNPKIGDIYIETTSYGSINKVYIRAGLAGIDTLWSCIWADQDQYISGYSIIDKTISTSKLLDKSITTDKLSKTLQDLLNNSLVQKFVGETKPNVSTYVESNDNPKIGDIYIEKNEFNDVKKLYVRVSFVPGDDNNSPSTIWKCIWSRNIEYDDNGFILGESISNKSITLDHLDNNLIENLSYTKVQKFYGTTEPDNRTFSDPKYNPKIGDIYIESTNYGSIKVYIRAGLAGIDTLWSCIWADQDQYVSGYTIFDKSIGTTKLLDKAITMNKLSKDVQDLLHNSLSQRFTGYTAPNNTSYIDSSYNPNVGDMYIFIDQTDEFNIACNAIYIREELTKNDSGVATNTKWRCIWSNSEQYIPGYAINDNSVNGSKIINNTITRDKLDSNLDALLIKGTYGTSPMNEGDSLEYGHVYIQYDEN